ncbi:MAG: hypothetical protein ACPHO0_08115, partial [Luminiphilus sp.]
MAGGVRWSHWRGAMRKILISVAAVLAVGAGGAYLYPSAAILTAIKVRTSVSTAQIGPPRDIAWQQGPAAASTAPGTVRFGTDDALAHHVGAGIDATGGTTVSVAAHDLAAVLHAVRARMPAAGGRLVMKL